MKKEIFCQNCQEDVVAENAVCPVCDEPICHECGCTDSHACADLCEWIAPGLCSSCDSADREIGGADDDDLSLIPDALVIGENERTSDIFARSLALTGSVLDYTHLFEN